MRRTAPPHPPFRLNTHALVLIGAVLFGILFALAWATAAMGDRPAAHAFLGIITQQALRSSRGEFAAGLAGAVALGALAGALVALGFNLLAGANRR